MNCNTYSVLLEKYLDGSLTPAEQAQMQQHESMCAACAAQRRTLSALQDELTSLKDDVPAMPEGFHQAWMTRVEEDPMENRETKPRLTRQFTRILSTAAAVVFVLGGTLLTRDSLAPSTAVHAPAGSASIYGTYEAEESYDSASNGVMLANYDGASAGSGVMYSRSAKNVSAPIAQKEQKIIRSASMTIGSKQYDTTLAALRSLCETSGGWISHSSENISGSLRHAYLTLRIPADQLDACLEGAVALGRVISRDESATDVTESYYDTKSRLDTQLALMARLQSLVTDAATLSDLLALESQIADTQYMIDTLQSSLNSTDRQVDYATVDIHLREESSAASLTDGEKTLLDRLGDALDAGLAAFLDFAEDVLVFLTAALPFLAIVGIVWLVARFIRRKKK